MYIRIIFAYTTIYCRLFLNAAALVKIKVFTQVSLLSCSITGWNIYCRCQSKSLCMDSAVFIAMLVDTKLIVIARKNDV